MQALEYLSAEPKHSFDKAQQVLQEGKDYYAEIETSKGKILIDLFEKETPITVNSFVFLALNRFYEGIRFHRVIPGFVAQVGDPTSLDASKQRTWGSGGPGNSYRFGLEVRKELNYDAEGYLGMARTQDPNSNGSQFFITLAPTPFLNQQYTIFGKVVEGMDVVKKLQPTEENQRPLPLKPDDYDKIIAVKILVK